MGRPAKPKVEKKPLVVHNSSEPFYKAFMFPEKDIDMVVDTSGDVFSHSIEDAILTMFDQMDQKDIIEIPGRLLSSDAGEPVNITNPTDNPNMQNLVILRMFCHWDEEFTANCSEDDGHNFIMQLNGTTDGYTTGLQEYRIDNIEFKADGPSQTPKLKLKSMEAEVTDPDRASPLFPKQIKM